jgi:A/G-specific adenine glycosylase
MTPDDRPGDFAQALMDLGSLICTPRSPRCEACPLADRCAAHAQGLVDALPVRPPRRERPARHGSVWWIGHQGRVALVRRPPGGLLGGMLALPGSAWGDKPSDRLPFPSDWRWLDRPVEHGFTHFRLALSVAVTEVARPVGQLAGETLLWERADDAPLPSLYAAVRSAVGPVRDGAAR